MTEHTARLIVGYEFFKARDRQIFRAKKFVQNSEDSNNENSNLTYGQAFPSGLN